MEQFVYGTLPDGRPVHGFRLQNANGMAATLIEYGAILTELQVPDRDGKRRDVVLGFPTLAGYLGEHPCFGTVVGRYANRIAQGQFTLDGQTYHLAQNEAPHHLHGGHRGFDKQLWQGDLAMTDQGAAVTLRYLSPDGEEGYPGNLSVAVTYILSYDNRLIIRYAAETDAPTVVNLTHHAYFNLNERGPVATQELQIFAEEMAAGLPDGIPTGEKVPVSGTAFDFLLPKPIGQDLFSEDPQLRSRKGYDHCYLLPGEAGTLRLAAVAHSRETGIRMETLTTEPALQLYTGNWLQEHGEKRGGLVDNYHAFCLETQQVPDAPNRPEFPSPVLRPGESWRSETQYRFSR